MGISVNHIIAICVFAVVIWLIRTMVKGRTPEQEHAVEVFRLLTEGAERHKPSDPDKSGWDASQRAFRGLMPVVSHCDEVNL
jgi:hypothetical protein